MQRLLPRAALGLALSALAIPAVQAHDISGRLLAKPGSTASYEISCYNDGNGAPGSLSLNVQGRTRAARFQVRATIDGVSVTDPNNRDRNPGPTATIAKGAGPYLMTISKSKPQRGVMVFSSEYHCLSATGEHVGTNIVKR